MKNERIVTFVALLFILFHDSLQNEETRSKGDLFNLAQQYLSGKGEKNVHKALELLEEAAKEDHMGSLFLIGRIYEFGEGGVKRDFEKAMSYFNRSAALGDADALQQLSFMWGTGKGVPINKPLALLYLAFAAQGGNTAAEMSLGYKYLNGLSVVKSCSKAAHRYELAASKVVENMKGVAMSSTFHTEHVRLADAFESSRDKQKEESDIVQYYQYSADTGDAPAQVTMGTLHLQGAYGVDRNFDTAFNYFQRAAAQGDAGGLANLGFMYANGHGTEQNNDTAIKYYIEAAQKGHALAQTNLGFMYMNGYGVAKNLHEAFRYFKMAADQGSAEGQVNVGTLYYNGEGVKQDYVKALAYFSAAAQQSHLVALYNLGQMHHFGLGTAPSCQLAVQLYKKVAEKGSWSQIIHQAYDLYQKGDFEGALLRYEMAAEQGYEIAQSNAGWILDKGLANLNSDKKDDPERYVMALEYYRNSAEQKNALAHLKMGDYYFYGFGTEVDLEKAAAYYQAASDMRSAQATFNLGYMHQHGLGLPRDLYLAKRHYDLALQVDPDSYLAIYLSLISVGGAFVVDWYSTGQLEIWGMQWDTILIIVLSLILFICIILRQNQL